MTTFSERVLLQLKGLRAFLAGLSGTTMDRVPASTAEAGRFLSRALTCLTALGFVHEVLYRRVLANAGINPGITSDIEKALLGTDLPRRQRRAKAVEAELWTRLEDLNSTIGYLTHEELEALAERLEDLPEALALLLTVEQQLIWYLDVHLAKRVISSGI